VIIIAQPLTVIEHEATNVLLKDFLQCISGRNDYGMSITQFNTCHGIKV